MSTVGDTIDRLEALVVLIQTGITVSPRYDCKIDPATLPTFIILPQSAVQEYIGSGDFVTTRDYLLLMLVQQTCDDKPDQQQTAREACYPFLDSVPRFFASHRYLELDDTGLVGVIRTTPPREDGAQLTTWGGETFSAIPFRMSVTTADEV